MLVIDLSVNISLFRFIFTIYFLISHRRLRGAGAFVTNKNVFLCLYNQFAFICFCVFLVKHSERGL